jgi:hypothetical protein
MIAPLIYRRRATPYFFDPTNLGKNLEFANTNAGRSPPRPRDFLSGAVVGAG